tara:strand:- start:308 stop:2632 length:2325 start_codon:yes stop_codon:yes gene_type:complete
VKISADRDTLENAVFKQTGSSTNIVDNQSNYQVGVVRFKVPLSAIPLYRIYADTLYINYVLNNGIRWTCPSRATTVPNPTYIPQPTLKSQGDLSKISLFQGGCATMNYGNYGVDTQNGNKQYVDIYSHSQFTDLLNNAIMRASSLLASNRYYEDKVQDPNPQIHTQTITLKDNVAVQAGIDLIATETSAVVPLQTIYYHYLPDENPASMTPVKTGPNQLPYIAPGSTITNQGLMSNIMILNEWKVSNPDANIGALDKSKYYGGIFHGDVIVGVELNLNNIWNLSDSNGAEVGYNNTQVKFDDNKFDMSMWEFVLQKMDGYTPQMVEQEFVFCNGILKGVGRLEQSNSQFTRGLKIGTTANCCIDAQSQITNELYDSYHSTQTFKDITDRTPFSMYPSQTNFAGIMGIQYSFNNNGGDAVWRFGVRNKTILCQQDYIDITGDGTGNVYQGTKFCGGFQIPDITNNGGAQGYVPNTLKFNLMPKAGFKYAGVNTSNQTGEGQTSEGLYGIDSMSAFTNGNGTTVSRPPIYTLNNRIPQFLYNENNKKISLVLSNQWANKSCFTLYMNERLSSMVSFGEYRVGRPVMAGNKIFETTNYENRYSGFMYSFPCNLGKILPSGNMLTSQFYIGSSAVVGSDSRSLNTPISFEESFSTSYCRDWLNGIIISTGNIAVDGEIEGLSDSKRKVLTDFIIDPSTTNRDYIIYNDSGGTRYYKLNTTRPLDNVDIQVFFQDIWGIIRKLYILPSQECSIKVEFKPNNMIYNYINDVSTYTPNFGS